MCIKKIASELLLTVIIICIFLITFAIYNLSFVVSILSNISYVLVVILISFFLSLIFHRNKKLGAGLILLFLVIISFLAVLFQSFDNQNTEKVKWTSPENSFTVNFVVGNYGHIFLQASVNDTSGLFLFDTGAGISHVNEKFVTNEKMKLQLYTLTDANGIKQTKNLYKVKQFVLGGLTIKRLQVYPADSLTWDTSRGVFYQQDTVIGVIGNNIISKFTWDFDMIKKQVTISKSEKYCLNLPDSLSVALFDNNGNKDIPVIINGIEKKLTFDFGAHTPLSLSDTVPNKSTNPKGVTMQGKNKGAFSHLDTVGSDESNSVFVNVQLGRYNFKEIKCSENQHCNLLGVPFIWTFERVIVDYRNNKVFFVNEVEQPAIFGVKNFNSENDWRNADVINFIAKPNGMVIVINTDSIETRYVVFGRYTLYKTGSPLDSMIFHDSVLYAGRKQYGPLTLRINKVR